MEKMTEEEKKMMDELVEEIKKEKKMKQTAPEKDDKPYERIRQKSVEDLKEEAREKGMMKKPYLERRRDRIDKRKEDRAEEKRIYKEEYKKHKAEAIKKRAKRKAGERFKYTTREKVTGSVKRPPATHKKRKTYQTKKRQYKVINGKAYPIANTHSNKKKTASHQYQPQRPRGISFDDALGSFGQPQQQKTTYKPVNFNTQVDYGSALGGFGSKKKKPIDPFEKLF